VVPEKVTLPEFTEFPATAETASPLKTAELLKLGETKRSLSAGTVIDTAPMMLE
jgi:hypothetical protein